MPNAVGESNRLLIYDGATQIELARLFGMTPGDVKARIAGVKPAGQRSGSDVWHVRDVAPFLTIVPASLIDRVARMNPNDLPRMLAKEYWAGQKARLEVLEKVGDLWTTRAVVDNCGQAFKTMRMSLMLMLDTVEREVGLEDAQRKIIDRMVRTLLTELKGKLVDGFNERRESSFGKSFAPVEDDGDEDL